MYDMYAAMLAAADAKKKYGGTDGAGLPPRLSETSLNATYAAVGGRQEISKQLSTLSANASANVTAINAAISTASANGGGTVIISVPGTYVINDHILMRANVTLRVERGVTIQKAASATGNVCMLRNANMSTTAPYTDVNMVLEGGGTFDGNYANNNAIVAQADQTAATVNTLAYGVQGDTSWIGVSNLRISNMNFINMNGFCVQIVGDDWKIENCTTTTARDFIHINGPSKHGVIRECYGKGGDAFIALNAWDWHRSGPSVGDIQDITIDQCTYLGSAGIRATTGTGLVFLPGTRAAGAGIGTGNIRDIKVRGLRVENAPGIWFLSDFDAFNGAEYSGTGTVENVRISGGYLAPDAASGSAISIYKGSGGTPADGQTSLTLRNVVIENIQTNLLQNLAQNAVIVSYLYTGLAMQGVVFRDCSWMPLSAAASSSNFLNIQSKSALDGIEIDGLSYLNAGAGAGYNSPAVLVNTYNGSAASEVRSLGINRIVTAPGVSLDSPVLILNGIVDWLTARGWTMTFMGGSGDNHGIYFGNAVAQLKGGTLTGLNLTNPKELFRIGNGATGSVICKATVHDSTLVGCTHPVFISGSRQADISFRGGNIDTAANLARVDTSTLTLTLDGTTSTGAGANVITQVSTTTLRVPRADRVSLALNTLTLTPSDGDQVYSSSTPSAVVSGTGAGYYVYRGSAGWVKLN